MTSVADYVVVGAGAAGCAVAASLAAHQAGSVLVVEAGPGDRHPLVSMPLGLVWLMNSSRDWRFISTPQPELDARCLRIPRGRMVGGSAALNSMVWFRGRRDDFDAWGVPGWRWDDVEGDFQAVEGLMRPQRLIAPHPLSEAMQHLLGGTGTEPPTPECESAGVFHFNMKRGRRWSPADAFLKPEIGSRIRLLTGRTVAQLQIRGDRATGILLADGSEILANKAVVLSAGAIGSPAILLKSGIGPAEDLQRAGIDVVCDDPGVGANLHDHPAAGLHYAGPRSGYGLAADQAGQWLAAPLRYLARGTGPLGSPTVEAGAFFNAADTGGPPDVQVHFIPFMRDWQGRRFVRGSGYFADVCLCRPKSRGRLSLTPQGLAIDLGIFRDPSDLELLATAWLRLRQIMRAAPFGKARAPEAFPGPSVPDSIEAASRHIRSVAATAYHPVGTLGMGVADMPVTPDLRYRRLDGLRIADASVMPQITSANTNAPSILIGYRGGRMIAERPQ